MNIKIHRVRRTLGAAVVATTMSAGLLMVWQNPAAAAGCTDGDRNGAAALAARGQFSTPAGPAYVWNRKIELRYDRISRCVWGLISQGNNGDEIWVERSSSPNQQLGRRSIQNGNGSTYTGLYNDAQVVSRACGKAGNRPEVACTGWV
jgi:hypothetical protein